MTYEQWKATSAQMADEKERYPDEIHHREGIWWYEAPIPRRWHRCTPWTQAWYGPYNLSYTERCSCGAMRISTHDSWYDKNSRRRK